MRILSRVCAVFNDRTGKQIHRVYPKDLLVMHDAPDSIKEDPLFNILLADKSLEVIPENDKKKQKKLENDPTEGVDASGKSIDIPEVPVEKEAGESDAKEAEEETTVKAETEAKAKSGSKARK